MGGDIPYKGMNSNGKSNILSIFYFPGPDDTLEELNKCDWTE